MSLDVYLTEIRPTIIYRAGITSNLFKMTKEAGINEYLWKPEEVGCKEAKDLIEPLSEGLKLLKSDPERFKKFDPPNKWGDYGYLVTFVEEYLEACRANPEATIEASG